jgi:hypothetical protein
MKVNRDVPTGFRYVSHVGDISGQRIWCVFTKNKLSYRFYHPATEARAVFAPTRFPPFKLHDTHDPAELDYVREIENKLYLASGDVLAVYYWDFTMNKVPQRVFSEKYGSLLRIPSETKIREIFRINLPPPSWTILDKVYIWIGKERFIYDDDLKTIVRSDIIVSGSIVDFHFYQTADCGWNLWFTGPTDYIIKNNNDSSPLVIN